MHCAPKKVISKKNLMNISKSELLLMFIKFVLLITFLKDYMKFCVFGYLF
jgi:uncharacterized membrane protein (DUF485 family)